MISGENKAVDLFLNDDVGILGGHKGEMGIIKVGEKSAEGTFFFTATSHETNKAIEVTDGFFESYLNKVSIMKSLFFLLTFCQTATGLGQAKLIINGGIINITNGSSLVIDNPDNTAILRNNSGYIQSEGMNNQVVWTIGIGNGNSYLVPFGNAADYLPLYFNAASGSGVSGQFIFTTYPTPTWKNSDDLPPGVSNVNNGNSDNSANVIDRFWQLKPQGYTTAPSLTNLIFTYSDNEYAPPNTIKETSLIVQRWNTVLKRWDDYFPASAINTTANTITVSSIPGDQLFDWWTMVSSSSALPVSLVYFKAAVQTKKVITNWQTSSEQNSDHFEVWRSKDAQSFNSVGKLTAAGNSNVPLNYTFYDLSPYSGISYYRLKSVDRNATFKWSSIVSVNMDAATTISIFPNPAKNFIILSSSSDVVKNKPLAKMYDGKGSLLQSFFITSTSQQINTGNLPNGTYHIVMGNNNQIQTLSFIKK